MATYFIRQGTHGAQGPFDEPRIAGYIAQGKVRPGMEISPDGQRWMPVEEHRLFASAAPASSAVPPPLPVAPAVVGAVEDVPASDTGSVGMRHRRRAGGVPEASAPKSGGGRRPWVIVGGLLLVGAAYNAVKGKEPKPSPAPEVAPAVLAPPIEGRDDHPIVRSSKTVRQIKTAFNVGQATTVSEIEGWLGKPTRVEEKDWSKRESQVERDARLATLRKDVTDMRQRGLEGLPPSMRERAAAQLRSVESAVAEYADLLTGVVVSMTWAANEPGSQVTLMFSRSGDTYTFKRAAAFNGK